MTAREDRDATTLLDAQPITSRLAGAGSLRPELEALLVAAPTDATTAAYRDLVLQANATGKGSASARIQVWKRLRLRYVLDPTAPEFRAFLEGMRSPAATTDDRGLLCLLMLAWTDRLFRELTLSCVSPLLRRDGTAVDPATIDAEITRVAHEGEYRWSQSTREHIRSHLLSALKDVGVLRGSAAKRIVRPRPGAASVVFAVRLARLEGLSDRQALSSRWFALLGLDDRAATDALHAAARKDILGFRVQADVVEITLAAVAAPVAS